MVTAGLGTGRSVFGELGVLMRITLILAACCTGCGVGVRFVDLWLTPDQQGQRLFERGDFAEAALVFEDPLWKGTALYRSEQFGAAIAQWTQLDNAEAWFNRGNALAHMEQYEEAIAAYERALELQPDHSAAMTNIDYLQPFLPLEFEGGTMGTEGRDAAADEVVFDADGDRLDQQGIDTEVEESGGMMTDAQLAEIWLRQVDASPAAFLRYKFQYQASRSEAD